MCGWGAGGESGPGSGCGLGRQGGMSWGTHREGGCQGNALAGQGVSLRHRVGVGRGKVTG